MSISFTCLFLSLSLSFSLVFIILFISLFRLFPSKREKNLEPIYFSCVVCTCVSQRDLCRKQKLRKKRRWNSFVCLLFFLLFMCLWLSIYLSTFFLFFLFVSCCCVPNCVFLFFFMPPLLLPPPLFSSIYLLSDCVCVCVCQLLLSAVCLRACVQITHFILLFSVYFFFVSFIKKNSLIYSQLKREKNQQLYYLSFCVLVCSYLHGCCVCVCGFLFFSVDYRWVSGCLYFIYLYVCMCVVCVIITATWKKRISNKEKKRDFCFVVMYGKQQS